MKMYKYFINILFLTLVSQILMLFRSSQLAGYFGTGIEMDAYNFSNTIIVTVINIVSAAIVTILVPYLIIENDKKNNNVINTYIFTLFISSFFVVSIILIISKLVILVVGGNSFIYLAFNLAVIFSIAQLVKLLSSIKSAFLQVNNQFHYVKIGAILPIGLSYIYLWYKKDFEIGITEVAWIMVVAYVVEYLYLSWSNRKNNYTFNFQLVFKNKNYLNLVKKTIPVALSSGGYQLTIIISNIFSSFLGVGYLSAMGYSNQIVSIFQGLVITNLLTIIYPNLTQYYLGGNLEALKKGYIKYVKLANMLIIPIVFGVLFFGNDLVRILFEHGEFTRESTSQVTLYLRCLVLSLPFLILRDFAYKLFYILGDTIATMKNAFLVIPLQLGFMLVMLPFINIFAVIFSPLVGLIFSNILIYRKLGKKIGKVDLKNEMFNFHMMVILSSSFMYLIMYLTRSYVGDSIYALFFQFILGIIVYGTCQYKEIKLIWLGESV